MNLHLLHGSAPPSLGPALKAFEQQFRYPLGQGVSFSISHGQDYTTFFQAMGECAVVVAEREGQVLATLGASLRPVRLADGRLERAVYLGDLKVAPAARGGSVLARVMGRLRAYYRGEAADGYQRVPSGLGYGVVMDGTGRTPFEYTGRLGVPRFRAVASLLILAVVTESAIGSPDVLEIAEPAFEALQSELAPLGVLPCGGRPELRSQLQPVRLGGRKAAGLLEDTRRGKRLFLSPTREMRAAHLSRWVSADAPGGAAVIQEAARRCQALGIPTMFVSLPAGRAAAVLQHLEGLRFQPAPATVFAHGFAEGEDWWVDTAEI